MLETKKASVKQLVPGLRLAIAHKAALEQRLAAIKHADGSALLVNRPTAEQVAFLRASSLVHMSGIYIGSVVTNLAHSPEAFALLSPELEPHIVEHARDSAADEMHYGPMQGVTEEATIVASLTAIEDDLKLATSHLSSAFTLLNSISTRR